MEFETLEDRNLVAMLIEGQLAAWNYLLRQVVAPLVETQKCAGICNRYSIEPDAVCSQVWTICAKNDYERLRAFRFESSLKTYLGYVIREALRTEVRKVMGKVPLDLFDDPAPYEEKKTVQANRQIELDEALDNASLLMGELWKQNPQQVLVLLLREHLMMSGKDVADLLGMTLANVNQMKKRATERMMKLKEQSR